MKTLCLGGVFSVQNVFSVKCWKLEILRHWSFYMFVINSFWFFHGFGKKKVWDLWVFCHRISTQAMDIRILHDIGGRSWSLTWYQCRNHWTLAPLHWHQQRRCPFVVSAPTGKSWSLLNPNACFVIFSRLANRKTTKIAQFLYNNVFVELWR